MDVEEERCSEREGMILAMASRLASDSYIQSLMAASRRFKETPLLGAKKRAEFLIGCTTKY